MTGVQTCALPICYGSLLDSTPDALIVVDGNSEIVLVNAMAARQFDYDAHDLVGTRLVQVAGGALIEQLVADGAEATIAALGDLAVAGVEFMAMRRDGSRFPAEAALSVVEASDGMLLLLAIRNVTARKVAERSLAAEAVRARGLFDQAPVALIVTNKRNRIIAINTSAQQVFGKPASEIAGQPVDTVLPLALAEAILASHDEGADTAGAWRSYDLPRPGGTPLRFDAAISAVQDANGRVAITAIREPEGRVATRPAGIASAALRAAPDTLIVVDQRGDIALANVEAERRFGYTEAELIGCPASRLLPGGLTERLQPDALRSAEAAMARELGAGIELIGQRRDSSRFPVEMFLAPLVTEDGSYWIVTLRDLSVPRAAERRLAPADGSAGRTEVLATDQNASDSSQALEQFAYLVAHDLQEPLRMVASYTDLLGERYKGQLDADADNLISYAVDGARRMQTLIVAMLDYCRIDTTGLQPEQLSSGELLQQVLADLQQLVKESGARISCRDLPAITGDRTQIAQVFQNLIANAVKFRRGEPLTIDISASRTESGEWEFAFADNGIGIASENLEKIFTMFYRLHRHDDIPGSGIGLAAARRVVERHGGHIWASSTPDVGSTFYFTLPAAGKL